MYMIELRFFFVSTKLIQDVYRRLCTHCRPKMLLDHTVVAHAAAFVRL